MKKVLILMIWFVSVLIADTIRVSDVEATYGAKKVELETKDLVQSLNFGFANTSGNVDTLNVNGKYTLALSTKGYADQDLRVSFNTALLVTENEGIRDNEEYTVHLGLEQFIIYNWLAYVSLDWLSNTFRNFDHKLLVGTGLGKEVFNDLNQTLQIKVGLAYNMEEYTNAQPEHDFTSLTQYIEYNNQLNKVSLLYGKVGASENINDMNDYEILAVFGFNFDVGEKISVTLEGEVRYDNLPPLGFEKVDTKTIVRVGYNF